MIPVENYSHLYRDEKTNAIINVDDGMYQNYINSKTKLIENQKKIQTIENELNEIKLLLKGIINNK